MYNLQIRDFSQYTDFLPLQFRDSDNLIKLLTIYLDQVEELNKAQQDLSLLSSNINTATGYQLDIIGNLLGARREGRFDEDYRNYIRFRISINTGSGTPEDLIGFLKTVTQANTVRYWENQPACVIMETDGETIPTNLVKTVDNITPAGVKIGGVIVKRDDYCFRPCRLSEAFTTQSGDSFLQTSPYDTYTGQAVLPNVSEVYLNLSLLAGDPEATAGDPQAVASGLALVEGRPVTGVMANVHTLK